MNALEASNQVVGVDLADEPMLVLDGLETFLRIDHAVVAELHLLCDLLLRLGWGLDLRSAFLGSRGLVGFRLLLGRLPGC